MIRDADILRGGALLLAPMAQNVLRGPRIQILCAEVDALRGEVWHLPQAHFARPQDLARVQILIPENHPRHGDAPLATADTNTPGRIAPAPSAARAQGLPA